jgi:hypothetical protein
VIGSSDRHGGAGALLRSGPGFGSSERRGREL